MYNQNDFSITFRADDDPDYSSVMTKEVGSKMALKFKVLNPPAKPFLYLYFKCCKLDDPRNEREISAITYDNFSKIDFSAGVSRVDEPVKVKIPLGTKEFDFEIYDFRLLNFAGVSQINVVIGKDEVAKLTIQKLDKKKPLITSFRSDKYFVSNGMTAKLTWQCENVTGYKINNESETGNAYTTDKLHGNNKFTLTAFRKDEEDGTVESVTKTIEITAYGNSEIVAEKGLFPDDSRVLGLYPYPEKNTMYAFVQKPGEHTASLYIAPDVVTSEWEEVIVYKDNLGADGDGHGRQKIETDLETASRPGVVFDRKLWFIGGSTHDPDIIGDTYSTYDIEQQQWYHHPIAIKDGNNNIFTPRMGHSCVVHNGKIWVIGGCNPDFEYALADIWLWNVDKWERYDKRLPQGGRCMMAVCSRNVGAVRELWMYGGYKDIPGGALSYELYMLDASGKFNEIKLVSPKETDKPHVAYTGASLLAQEDDIYIFSDNIYRIYYSNNKWEANCLNLPYPCKFDINGNYFQTVPFLDVTWINVVHFYQAEKQKGRLGKIYYVKLKI